MIPTEDHHAMGLLYKRKTYPPSRWRIIAYCDEPTLIMENIDTHEQERFGVSSLTAQDFEPVFSITK